MDAFTNFEQGWTNNVIFFTIIGQHLDFYKLAGKSQSFVTLIISLNLLGRVNCRDTK